MPTRVVIPFSELNQIPGVGGVEDVVFSIPTLDDITRAIRRETLDRTDLDEVVVEAVESAISGGVEIVADAVDLSDETIARLVEEIEALLGIDVPGDGSVIDGVSDVVLGREELEEIIYQGVVDVLNDVTPEEINVEIEGIFGPLAEDVARALEDIIGFDPDEFIERIVEGIEDFLNDLVGPGGDIDLSIPTIKDVENIIESGLDGLSPDIEGVEFWSDPLAFLAELWDEIEELLVSPESSERLRQAVEDAPERRRGRR